MHYKSLLAILFSITLLSGSIPLSLADLQDGWTCENQTIKQLSEERIESGDKIIVSKDVDITFCRPPPSEIEKAGCTNPQFGPIPWLDRFENGSKIMPDLQKNIDRTTNGNLCVTIVLPHVLWKTEDIRSEYELSVEHRNGVIQSKKIIAEYLADNGAKPISGETLPSTDFDASIPLSTNLAELASMKEIKSIGLTIPTGPYRGQDKIDDRVQKLFDVTDLNMNVKYKLFYNNPNNEGYVLHPFDELNSFEKEWSEQDTKFSRSELLEKSDDIYIAVTINAVSPTFSQDKLIEEWEEQGFTYKSNSELEAERTAKIAYLQHKILRILNESSSAIGRINNDYIEASIPLSIVPKLESMDEVVLLDTYGKIPVIDVVSTAYRVALSGGAFYRLLSDSGSTPLEFVLDVSDKSTNLDDVSMNVTISENTAKIEIIGDNIHAVNIPKEALGKDIKVIHNGISTDAYEMAKQADGTSVLLLSPITHTTDAAQINSISSPHQQLKWGVLPEDIICNSDHVLVIDPNGSGACVKDSTAIKLIERGWKTTK